MEFNKIAYCIAVPWLLIFSWLYADNRKRIAINLLSLVNLLLIGNSFFVVKQLWGFYQMSKHYSSNISWYLPRPQTDIVASTHLLAVILLPLFSVLGFVRRSPWFSLLVLAVIYTFYPFSTWNFYNASMKSVVYVCLLCSLYALFWLYNLLPYQSSSR